jgi:hypothetical protein
MFAHGKKELRTPEMNEAEGINNDKAIRAFLQKCTTQRIPAKSTVDDHSGAVLERRRSSLSSRDGPAMATTTASEGTSDAGDTERRPSAYRYNPYSLERSKTVLVA